MAKNKAGNKNEETKENNVIIPGLSSGDTTMISQIDFSNKELAKNLSDGVLPKKDKIILKSGGMAESMTNYITQNGQNNDHIEEDFIKVSSSHSVITKIKDRIILGEYSIKDIENDILKRKINRDKIGNDRSNDRSNNEYLYENEKILGYLEDRRNYHYYTEIMNIIEEKRNDVYNTNSNKTIQTIKKLFNIKEVVPVPEYEVIEYKGCVIEKRSQNRKYINTDKYITIEYNDENGEHMISIKDKPFPKISGINYDKGEKYGPRMNEIDVIKKIKELIGE